MSEVTERPKLSSPAEYFEQNLYVLLDRVLTPEFCGELSNHMFTLYENDQLRKDDQCPKSDAVYGDPMFDGLLEKLAEPIGQHLNKTLIPTYTYARIYRPGEVLERHTDRPACEISGTMTLGHDSINVWPIFVTADPNDSAGKRVDLKVGDILMYKGEELAHWRPAFKGQWQCQVFFHFVDADGPHAAEAFDGRPQLGLSAESKGKELEEVAIEEKPANNMERRMAEELAVKPTRDGIFPIYGGVMIPSWDLSIPGALTINRTNHPQLALTDDECQKIINLASDAYADAGSIGMGNAGVVNKAIRNVNLYKIPLIEETNWIFDKISRAVSIANAEYYDFEIMGITHELQLLHYESGDEPGHYNWHMDIGGVTSCTRKISVSVQLTDPAGYEGGDLHINANGEELTAVKERGAMNMFPSYCMHRVTPMESGERWALVIWVHGSRRFR